MKIINCFVFLIGLVGLTASAQPTAVAAPVDVEPLSPLTKLQLSLRSSFAAQVEASSGANVATRRETDTALVETKRQDFRESDEALAQLAVKAKTLYALYTWVDLTTSKTMIMRGRVVRDDGKAMGTAEVQQALKKEKPEVVFKVLSTRLLEQLKLGDLPAQKEVVVAPALVDTPPVEVKKDPPVDFVPPPPPPLVELKDEGAGQRSAGQGLFATGLAVGAVGGIVAAVGGAVGGSVEKNGTKATTAEGAQSAGLGRTMTTVGFVGVGVGVAAAVVGAIVWGTAKPSPVKVSAMPTAGGAFVHVEAEF